MRLAAIALSVSVLVAATNLQAQTATTRNDRYELRVGKAKAAVYGAAMAALTDASFTTKEASQDAGVIQSEWRKPSDIVAPGAKAALKMLFSGDNPVRLNLVLIPIGDDSTRVTIAGELLLENTGGIVRIKPYQKKEWGILQGIGDEILKGLQ